MSLTIGIDVGGTFTDFVLAGEEELLAHKSPSTPENPAAGVLRGLAEIAQQRGGSREQLLGEVGLIVHGTTVTTNAVLTERGARTGLLTTEGFRDILQMRRGVRSRKHLYDNKYVAPQPLVPRRRRIGIRERTDLSGAERTPLDVEMVEQAVRLLAGEDVQALAICFMHSYANGGHEQAAKEIVQRLAPDLFLSVSSEVLPQVRLNERVGTTVMNAYVGPVLRSYIQRLSEELAGTSFKGALLIMQSNGGVSAPAVVVKAPASTVLSGPAGGPVSGLAYSRARGSEDCMIVDMGGTSFDVSIVKDGEVQVTRGGEINRHPIALPMTDIHTIGAGGGSIGWIDEGALLHMGPQSAGAEPGPAAYDRGGTLPTCTDADVVLGFIDPEFFLGGRIRLSAERAADAVSEEIAKPLGLQEVDAAAAMYEVINLMMAAGAKDMALERGYDPRELPLVVAGGAGPAHACAIAQELGIRTLLIPRLSSVLCALGMLLADLRHDHSRTHSRLFCELDPAAARAIIEEMIASGEQALAREGVPPQRRSAMAAADIRYVGQHHEVTVPFLPEDLNDIAGLGRIEASFHRRHEQLYGFASPGRAMEVITLHATSLGRRPELAPAARSAAAGAGGGSARKGERPAWVASAHALVPVEVFDGALLSVGERIEGPAIVEEMTTTIVVPERFDLTLDPSGSYVLENLDAAKAP